MIQFCSSFVPVFKIALSLEPQGMNQSSSFFIVLGSVYIYVCVICSIDIFIYISISSKKLENWNIATTTRDKPILKSGTDPVKKWNRSRFSFIKAKIVNYWVIFSFWFSILVKLHI